MIGGLIPRWIRRTDFDFFKNHLWFGAVKPTSYIAFDVDRNFPQFNQNAMALPEGCTGMAQSYICTCEDGIIADPKEIYDNTPPFNPFVGRDIRDALKRICTVGYRQYLTSDAPANPREAYYNVRPSGKLDWFDALYIALLSTKQYNRPTSIGVPWFSEFENPDDNGVIHLPAVIPSELQANGFMGTLTFFFHRLFGAISGGYSWHNAAISGVALINGEPHFKVYSWQGDNFGLHGAVYLNREDTNKLFDLYMTEAFICAQKVNNPQTIDTEAVEGIVAYIISLLS